jgi:hypothetical protein
MIMIPATARRGGTVGTRTVGAAAAVAGTGAALALIGPPDSDSDNYHVQ